MVLYICPMAVRNVFKALSDQSRFDMVVQLGEGPCTVDELRTRLDISQSSTSQHLKILHEAGLVSYSRHGNFRTYTLRKNELKKAMHFFDDLWDDGLERLKRNLES